MSPADIDTVLYTHLHNDHAGNAGLFTNSRLVFQKAEWLNLLNPLPVQNLRKDYDPGAISEIGGMNILPVDGDVEIEDGIKLYKTPGHSLGSQSIAVNTKKGVVVFIGDLCLLNFMMFPGTSQITDLTGQSHEIPAAPPALRFGVPHSVIYDYYHFYDSISRVRAIASQDEPGFIIPGHEPSLVVTGV